jgi:hypothetical protein
MGKVIKPAKSPKQKKAKSTPKGFHTIDPYFAVHGVPRLIGFLQQAFRAIEIHRHLKPDGDIANAELGD